MTMERERLAVVVDFAGTESRTKTDEAESCDINQMIARYQRGGQLPPPTGVGRYGDFTRVGTYLEAFLEVQAAQHDFMELPAKIRKRFHNDVNELIEFIDNPDNAEEAYELGLASREQLGLPEPPDTSTPQEPPVAEPQEEPVP